MKTVLRCQAKVFQNYPDKIAFHIYSRYVYKYNIMMKPFDLTTKESIKKIKIHNPFHT